jgi:hypothetical protein
MWLLTDSSFTKWSNSGDGDNLWTFAGTASIEAGSNTPKKARRVFKFRAGRNYKISIRYTLTDGVLTSLLAIIGGTQGVTLGSSIAETTDGLIEINFTSNQDSDYFEISANSTNLSLITISYVQIEDFNQSQFLTNFTRPKMWAGYPFLLSAAVGGIDDDLILTLKGYSVANALLATQQSAAESFTDQIIHFNVNEIYGSLTNVSYMTAYVETTLGEILTDTITIDVEEPCANPVYILGRNSLGGALQWMFDISQEQGYDTANAIKAKRHGLFTNHLTLNQWEALQEFITLGETYRNNITDFTSSTIKTSSRIGQQLYVVDSEGNKTGVIAIQTANSTLTKQIRHLLNLEIEYPEVFAL